MKIQPVYIEHSQETKKCSMYAGVQCIQVLSIWSLGELQTKSKVIDKDDHFIAKSTMSLPHFHHIVKNFIYYAFEKYHLKTLDLTYTI